MSRVTRLPLPFKVYLVKTVKLAYVSPPSVTAGSTVTLLVHTQLLIFPPTSRQPAFPLSNVTVKYILWLNSYKGAP